MTKTARKASATKRPHIVATADISDLPGIRVVAGNRMVMIVGFSEERNMAQEVLGDKIIHTHLDVIHPYYHTRVTSLPPVDPEILACF